ncbi:MAG: RNA methyltransferase [Clostridia bacterium]|nr:RNA methyltransferase [Clostridia bacterium]
MTDIQSVQNPVVKRLKGLRDKKGREESGEMLVEGEKLMLEAVEAGLAPSDALIEAEEEARFAALIQRMESCGALVYAVPRRVLEAVCDTRTPQGACAAFSLPAPFTAAEAPARLAALDGVQDPGNVGTIWRTADAAGLNGLLLSRACADPFSPKVQRAAMGSGFRVPASVTDDLPGMLRDLQARGYAIIASSLRGEPFYEGCPHGAEKFALVIGNEARGVSDEVMALADVRLKLPMRGGAESLNAAVAAGIMMYELMREQ